MKLLKFFLCLIITVLYSQIGSIAIDIDVDEPYDCSYATDGSCNTSPTGRSDCRVSFNGTLIRGECKNVKICRDSCIPNHCQCVLPSGQGPPPIPTTCEELQLERPGEVCVSYTPPPPGQPRGCSGGSVIGTSYDNPCTDDPSTSCKHQYFQCCCTRVTTTTTELTTTTQTQTGTAPSTTTSTAPTSTTTIQQSTTTEPVP